MVGVEYSNSKVRVTYSRSKIGVAVVVVVVVVVILLPDFIQLQITSNGSKTANIYVKKLFNLYRLQCNGDIVVVDIKQQKSQYNNLNITITQCQKNFADCVMVKFELLNCDFCCFISTTRMSFLHCSLYKLNSFFYINSKIYFAAIVQSTRICM